MYAFGFRFYFTPLSGVLFTFPSRYLCTIGCWRVISLGGWSPQFHTGFLVSRTTQEQNDPFLVITLTGLSPSLADVSKSFNFFPKRGKESAASLHSVLQHQCDNAGRLDITSVWAVPLSLAATRRFSVDLFSSGY